VHRVHDFAVATPVRSTAATTITRAWAFTGAFNHLGGSWPHRYAAQVGVAEYRLSLGAAWAQAVQLPERDARAFQVRTQGFVARTERRGVPPG